MKKLIVIFAILILLGGCSNFRPRARFLESDEETTPTEESHKAHGGEEGIKLHYEPGETGFFVCILI